MKKYLFLFSFLLLLCSCENETDVLTDDTIDPDLICEDCDIDIVKDSNRLTQYNQTVTLSQRGVKSKNTTSKVEDISLILKAKLAPLYITHEEQEVMLNANHVSVYGKKIAASYSLAGEPYSGAVDILYDSGELVNLQGTLLLPHRDIDAVSLFDSSNLFLGGGFDATEFYGGDHPSFFAGYEFKYNEKSDMLSLQENQVFHSVFGNKLRNIKSDKSIITGSGGGNSGVIFAFDENTETLILNESNETNGLYILDTSIEKRDGLYYFVAIAYNDSTKELKAFSYLISIETNIMTLNYEVSLGIFDLNVEAKHSLVLPRKDVLVVSLGSEGMGIYKVTTSDDKATATLKHQLKEEILDTSEPNHVVNSIVYHADMFYVAAGGAGIYIIPYVTTDVKFDENFYHVDSDPGISINNIGRSDDELVVATTEGISIYQTNGID
ncbi:hypothetical protein ACFQ5N_09235 [Lutibacter holmesii]|uniref:Uncharacterized protein n=1 Tax=Lutibacter holmesii TaxID=1137985 RepID=A0ABW3WQS1_9FLAO